MQKQIILASTNPGKLREYRQLLQSLPVELIPQSDLEIPSAIENGLSFVENAIIKARAAAQRGGLAAIGEDSGLAVAALGGQPGIYSARYAGKNASSEENIKKLLAALKDVPEHQRQAQFHCVIAFLRNADDPTPVICQGAWQGTILSSPQGHGGFGYDPIFYLPQHRCSAAELSIEMKNQISHRAQATQQLIRFLNDWLASQSCFKLL